MYLTAQHVRRGAGEEAIHAFLHLHDVEGGGGFPPDPLTVPQEHPGRIVASHTEIPMGGNAVISYLDVISEDGAWQDRPIEFWSRELESLGALMSGRPLPWIVEAGDMHVVFSATPAADADAEYEALVRWALGVWQGWRASGGQVDPIRRL